MAGKEDDAYGYIPVDDDGDTILNVVEGMHLKQARCFDLITTSKYYSEICSFHRSGVVILQLLIGGFGE